MRAAVAHAWVSGECSQNPARPYICLLIILKVHVALHATGVPFQDEAGGDGVEVLAQAAGEAAQRREAGGLSLPGPGGQQVAVPAGHHRGEGGHAFGGGIQLGTAGPQFLEPEDGGLVKVIGGGW